MRLTRRAFLGGAAAAAVGGAGIYELVDRLTPAPHRPAAGPMPREQHVFDLRSVQSDGIEVLVPPLHSEIVTATIKVDDLRSAQHDLEAVLQDLDTQHPPAPPAPGAPVARGLPHVPGASAPPGPSAPSAETGLASGWVKGVLLRRRIEAFPGAASFPLSPQRWLLQLHRRFYPAPGKLARTKP